MLIIGKRRSNLTTEHLYGLLCPNCKVAGQMQVTIQGAYIHLYWVPMFPLSKRSTTLCHCCKQQLQETEMPLDVLDACEPIRAATPQAQWHFVGLVLLLMLIGLVCWVEKETIFNDLRYGI